MISKYRTIVADPPWDYRRHDWNRKAGQKARELEADE